MKNRKNILTYIVAAVATLVTSASSFLGVPPLQPPKTTLADYARRVHLL